MKMRLYCGLILLFSTAAFALDYEVQIVNDRVHVAKVKIMPYEEIGLHQDEYPQVVVALQGGTITRLEADGSTVEVDFPTGKAVYRPVDPVGEYHRSINNSSDPIELIVTQLITDSVR